MTVVVTTVRFHTPSPVRFRLRTAVLSQAMHSTGLRHREAAHVAGTIRGGER